MGATWVEHRKRKKDAEEEQARLEHESRQKSAAVKQLDRLYRAIPELAKLENVESLRPVVSRKRTIQTLSSRHEALMQQAVQARKQMQEA